MASDLSAQDWKIVSLFLLLLLVWIGGLLPTQIGRLSSDPRVSAFILALGNAFSGGVFLCVALAHLMPDAMEELEDLSKDVPVATLLAILGFLIVFYVEKILMGGQHDEEVVAVTAAARAKKQHVDLIVVPRRVIPHYSTMQRIKDEPQDEDVESLPTSKKPRRHTWHQPNKNLEDWHTAASKPHEADDAIFSRAARTMSEDPGVVDSPQLLFAPRTTKA
eukprot:TRINITY_DN2146_c0_g1_i3.p1 TRINITY_DN2146_c0_g1~~TRINITY_DN2146_c0_g1_i3.p1  ORF type:complete len:228 (+),score=50.43 TRINITY_DN2146_c0_g1_i3:27-686(+)